MPDQPLALVGLCGSLRTGSHNRKLLAEAVAIAEERGATVDVIDLRALELPLYDGDLEAAQGLPPGAVELKRRLGAARGILLACPEYNHSVPGPFKNAFDWQTRGEGNPLSGKVVALMGASTGYFGTVRCMLHLRQIFMARSAWVIPPVVTVPNAAQAFDEAGHLKDPAVRKLVEASVTTLLENL